MSQELYSFLPLVVAVALLGFSIWAERKSARQTTQQGKWNEYVR
jgi:hypothetical protein